MSTDGDESELAELIAETREHLLWEMDLGARGLPAHEPASAPVARREQREEPPPSAPRREVAPDPAGDDRSARLRVIATEVSTCTKCRLHAGRTQTVFARGNPAAEIVFVGEGPGFNEDQQGLPFVGQAGQLLDKMIGAMGLSESEVYICNVVKCRPPDNRTPNPDEAAACRPYLRAQLEIVAPKMIVALGKCAAENLGLVPAAGPWRGVFGTIEGVRAIATYHPAYLLRSPENKRVVWQDLQAVVAALGRELPSTKR